MGELPEDAIEAAAKALAAQDGDDYDGSIYGADPAVLFVWGDHARAALAAALPFLERATRDKIAAEIEGYWRSHRDGLLSPSIEMYDLGALDAARVVRADALLQQVEEHAAARVARGGEATE